jgi:hypothetical protein
MSFSFRLPEEDPVCECRYDEIHDRMDREACPFHCDIVDDEPAVVLEGDRKPPKSVLLLSPGKGGNPTTGLNRRRETGDSSLKCV